MPIFNWTASSLSDVMSNHFWIYWAVAAPLTALVMGIVGAYALYQSRKNKKAAEEARKRAGLKTV